jgi:hypothetical protein
VKQFVKTLVLPKISSFNKWKKSCVARCLVKKQHSICSGLNDLKPLRDKPLHEETATGDFLVRLGPWLSLAHFDTAEWISQDWVEMGLRNVQARFRG